MGLKREIGKRVIGYGVVAVVLATGWHLRTSIVRLVETGRWEWPKRASHVSAMHGERVRAKYEPLASAAGLDFPPPKLRLLAFKREQVLEVWGGEPWTRLERFHFTATSGVAGPKRTRGDGQIPEGFYRLTTLNPDSLFHLSIRVDYPNAEDLEHAVTDDLGEDIYVHGRAASIGCIAIGDEAIEEVFTLAHWARTRDIVISPVDFRERTSLTSDDPWVEDLYRRIAAELARFQ